MRPIKFAFAVILSFVFAMQTGAGELTKTLFENHPLNGMRPPSIVALENQSRQIMSELRRHNTGADSVLEAARAAKNANDRLILQNATANTIYSNKKRNTNVDVSKCGPPIARGEVSCYGTTDGFGPGNHTKSGTPMSATNMIMACDKKYLGQVLVVRNPAKKFARYVTCADTGNFQRLGRFVDLGPGPDKVFGAPRCTSTSGSFENMELYRCPKIP